MSLGRLSGFPSEMDRYPAAICNLFGSGLDLTCVLHASMTISPASILWIGKEVGRRMLPTLANNGWGVCAEWTAVGLLGPCVLTAKSDRISTPRLSLLIDVGEGRLARDFQPIRTSPLLSALTHHKMLSSARTGASLALRGEFAHDSTIPRLIEARLPQLPAHLLPHRLHPHAPGPGC